MDAPENCLDVGTSGRFRGVYTAHWELARFVPQPAGRFVVQPCELVVDGAEARTLKSAVDSVADPRGTRLPAKRFEVVFDGTVLEAGRFGHLGTSTRRIRVDRWRFIAPAPAQPDRNRRLAVLLTVGAAIAVLAAALSVIADAFRG